MTILLCLFFQFFSTAHAEGWRDYIPTHEHYLKAHRWIIEHSSRETRLFLYSNMPSLFPVELLCQLHDGTMKKAILPGDTFQTQSDKADLDCKGLLQANFSKGTSGSIDFVYNAPLVALTQGRAEITTGGKPVSLQVPDVILNVTSSDPTTRFALRHSDKGSLISCENGLAESSIETNINSNANQKYIGATNCRLTVTGKFFTKKRFIFTREALHPADLGVKDSLITNTAYSEAKAKFGSENLPAIQEPWLFIKTNNTKDSKGPVLLQIDQKLPEPANCTLYSQASATDALTSAYQFKLGSQKTNVIKLHPDYRKYYISVVCTNSKGLLVSNFEPPYTGLLPSK